MAVQPAVKTKITDEDLLAPGEDVRVEVVNGQIVVDMTANKLDHTIYGQRLGTYLDVFVGTRKLGWVGGDMAAFKLKTDVSGGIKDARIPDVFYVSFERLPPDADIAIIPPFAPDLAVEVISESETHMQVLKKMNTYLDHGVREVWHVMPTLQQVMIFTPDNRAGITLNIDDTLAGGDLLPGFAVPVRAIFEPTDAELHAETLRRLLATRPDR